MSGSADRPLLQLAEEGARYIREGGVVLYPTETVYGLGCHPNYDEAVRRIQRLKGRDAHKPMLVLTDSWERVEDWLGERDPLHDRLMEIGRIYPLTILLPASGAVPESFRGGSPLVGIRCTTDLFCRALIASSDSPVLSTSANPAGEPAPAAFEDIQPEMLEGVDLAVDAGRPLAGSPSTVVSVTDGQAVVVREGAVPEGTIRSLLESMVNG